MTLTVKKRETRMTNKEKKQVLYCAARSVYAVMKSLDPSLDIESRETCDKVTKFVNDNFQDLEWRDRGGALDLRTGDILYAHGYDKNDYDRIVDKWLSEKWLEKAL
jgi:hypothetical protein